jgi:hypothetical protein
MLQEVLVEENYCTTHCMVKGTEDWDGNDFFYDPSLLSSNHKINWDSTIVIGDNDNDSLNSHIDIEQLQKLDNYAIMQEREIIEEEISFPCGPNIENVLDIEFQRKDAANAMQFIDFSTNQCMEKSTNCIVFATSSRWNSMSNTFSMFGPEGKKFLP